MKSCFFVCEYDLGAILEIWICKKMSMDDFEIVILVFSTNFYARNRWDKWRKNCVPDQWENRTWNRRHFEILNFTQKDDGWFWNCYFRVQRHFLRQKPLREVMDNFFSTRRFWHTVLFELTKELQSIFFCSFCDLRKKGCYRSGPIKIMRAGSVTCCIVTLPYSRLTFLTVQFVKWAE